MTGSDGDDARLDAFTEHRRVLIGAAYRVLGSVADAEDVVQEAWLRWAGVDLAEVRDPRAYLIRTVTRLALNRIRQQQRRREQYVGPWLPEPLLTSPDVAEDLELAESVSMAIMVVLETLAPIERAVFVLREAFGFAYEEIGDAVGKSPATVRQIAHRARKHVEARRPREPISPRTAREAVSSFQRALATGDFQSLLDVLAPDVVLLTDGGGLKRAAVRPVIGAQSVIRYMAGGISKSDAELTAEPTVVNGGPAVLLRVDGAIDGVLALRLEGARVAGMYYVRNPEKLGGMARETPLIRR